uniref:Uncharacterized protein n=1 Tax=Nelumbo nucifera TaxID=4432 RepID=A0A822Y4L5_NELNU|nr:TPA_asm: hypothetical protein HUJ06_027727 [Nelumbo nucifera]
MSKPTTATPAAYDTTIKIIKLAFNSLFFLFLDWYQIPLSDSVSLRCSLGDSRCKVSREEITQGGIVKECGRALICKSFSLRDFSDQVVMPQIVAGNLPNDVGILLEK